VYDDRKESVLHTTVCEPIKDVLSQDVPSSNKPEFPEVSVHVLFVSVLGITLLTPDWLRGLVLTRDSEKLDSVPPGDTGNSSLFSLLEERRLLPPPQIPESDFPLLQSPGLPWGASPPPPLPQRHFRIPGASALPVRFPLRALRRGRSEP
ncbi:hypothetical protein STEG23_004503, partial [Scotinomys teguina]